jgi:hypothetical protein
MSSEHPSMSFMNLNDQIQKKTFKSIFVKSIKKLIFYELIEDNLFKVKQKELKTILQTEKENELCSYYIFLAQMSLLWFLENRIKFNFMGQITKYLNLLRKDFSDLKRMVIIDNLLQKLFYNNLSLFSKFRYF